MVEKFPKQAERQPIDREVFDLSEGPIDFALYDHHLRIVVPGRDIKDRYNVDCVIIDPNQYKPRKEVGFKGLRDSEEVTLGREHNHGRFEFSHFVSRQHALISRFGDQIVIRDLASANGTYRLNPPREREETVGAANHTQIVDTPRPEVMLGSTVLAGASVPSDRHPERNEDAFFIDNPSRTLGVFDGVGGSPGSERASRLAAQSVEKHLRGIPSTAPRSLSHTAMNEALLAGHHAILDDSRGNIATTATVVKVFETETGAPYAVVASVGDSRAYLFRDDSLAHLTLDQAYRMPGQVDGEAKLIQETLAEATDISKLDAAAQHAFRHRNILSSCLGVASRPPVITINDFEMQQGYKLVVTSDGIHDNLTGSEIESILKDQDSAQIAVESLVQAARERSRDDSHVRAKADDMTAAVLCL